MPHVARGAAGNFNMLGPAVPDEQPMVQLFTSQRIS